MHTCTAVAYAVKYAFELNEFMQIFINSCETDLGCVEISRLAWHLAIQQQALYASALIRVLCCSLVWYHQRGTGSIRRVSIGTFTEAAEIVEMSW